MGNKYLDILTQTVRHTRHGVSETGAVSIEIIVGDQSSNADAPAEVVDFSRGGFRLRWGAALQKGEPLEFRCTDHSSELSLALPGTVRWCRELADKRFEAGVQFEQEIDYEHLGQLFIAGFLSAEEAAAH